MAPSSVGSATLTAPSSPASQTSQQSGSTNQSDISRGSRAPLLDNIAQNGGGSGSRDPRNAGSRATFARIQDSGDDTVGGWPRLAKLMEDVPSFAAFPRFDDANIKTLLYYQVEIAHLQDLLKLQEKMDRNVPTSQNSFYNYPSKMVESPECAQWVLIERLQKCVHRYNRALIEYAQVSALPQPSTNNMARLVELLRDQRVGNMRVRGPGSKVWGDQYATPAKKPTLSQLFFNIIRSVFLFWKDPDPPRTRSDLVMPIPRDPDDELTRWIRAEWMPFWLALGKKRKALWADFTKMLTRDKEKQDQSPLPSSEKAKPPPEKKYGVKIHSGKSMERFTSAVVTIVASMLPTMAIAILTTADSLRDKLLYIGGFTALFAVGLMILTSETSRVQIFTATAAFSAVLVVFVQNQ